MKQVTLHIKEGRFRFFMELIKSLDFVTVVETGDSKEEVRANVRKGLNEVELIEAGKLKGRPAQRLLDEL
ncbi:MAG: hypothetical protein RBT71_06010 [Flavobacteriales bacterium]|nr:hypothetical protein [Flavobacteriales bacterium]